jgi:hypothetical protein
MRTSITAFFAACAFGCPRLITCRRRKPKSEIYQHEDPEVLDWAALRQRVVLTHDVNTMTKYAYERLAAGQSLPGVIIVPKELPIGTAIEELVTLLYCSSPEEFPDRVIHLPL